MSSKKPSGKTKAAAIKAVNKMPEGAKRIKALKFLDKAIGQSKKGKVSEKELNRLRKLTGSKIVEEHPAERKRRLASQQSSGTVTNEQITPFSSTFTPPPPPTPPDVIVRIPERDVVNFVDENIPTELITNLLFENLGANELIKFERHDTIEGTNATYDIISNLTGIKKIFDPSTLISRQKPNTSFFDIFNIKLEDKIPTDLYLRNNPKIDATGEVNSTDYVYIDPEGNLVIELVNIDSDEILEVEIDSNGTIYEVTI
jgi:hypothetical protein